MAIPQTEHENRIRRRLRHPEEPRRRDRQQRRGCRDRQGLARLQQGGADSRLPAGQGADQGRAAALSRPDSPRRRARPDSARGRRSAARARRRAGRHARHQGRRRRRGPAPQVHGVVRDRPSDRAGRLLHPHGQARQRAGRGCGGRPGAVAAAGASGPLRADRGSRRRARRLGPDGPGADGRQEDRRAADRHSRRGAAARNRDRQARQRHGRHRRARQSSGLRRGAHRACRPATRSRSTSSIPRTTRSRSWRGRRCGTTWR